MENEPKKINFVLWKAFSNELESFLNKPIKEIEDEYMRTLEKEKDIERRLYESNDRNRVIEYYKLTSRYLYELVRWESTFEKQDNFRRLYLFFKKHKIKKVLDFGGGVGGLCIYLKEQGIECDYLDVCGETFRFARWRFQRRGLKIKMFNVLDKWPKDIYQAVVAYDVLEHLPNLEETMKKIADILNKRGFLLNKSTFSGGGLHLKKNEKYIDIKVFNDLLKNFGLCYYGRLKNSFFSNALKVIGVNKITGVRLSKKIKYGGNFLVYKKIY
ncbi:MAG: class I SAM-dependent methyltransferase [Thermodesulfobacterium sp.]|nr:class I SAM-dependent methyltransferase [Thermodesulfobacterium sp.]